MGEERKSGNVPIKVTDRRIFNADGDIREEFREEVSASATAPKPDAAPRPVEPPPEPRKARRDPSENPGTPFTRFIENLLVQGYMSLGLMRNPYQPEPMVDLAGARQMIEIISMLAEKTKGNLSEDEAEFLEFHLGDFKLRFVQQSRGAIR